MSLKITEMIMKEFLDELSEMTERISLYLTALEKNPRDFELIRSIYRDIHTLKGNAMMFGLPLLGQLTHAIENVLELIREKNLAIGSDISQQIFLAIDLIELIAVGIKENKSEPDVQMEVIKHAEIFNRFLEKIDLELNPESKNSLIPTRKVGVESSDEADLIHQDTTRPQLRVAQQVELTQDSEASNFQQAKGSKGAGDDATQDSIRVNVVVLDRLMNLAGELVLIRNQYQERAKLQSDEDLQIFQNLNVVIADLQSELMKTRMQPVGNVLNKFHRVVRDLAHELEKEIEIQILGAETELDRALLEAIRDPLMHIVRNSADHGIELPEERLQKGKQRSGTIQAKSYQQGGQVVIEITDDGKGLDPRKIKKKALERSIISEDQASSFGEQDFFQLLFHPGFSTAEKLSNVSGRGVGMDVVKTNIERIGGNVELSSKFGFGTSTVLRIPLTLAILPALIVKQGPALFAIPQSRIIEVLQVDSTSEKGPSIEFLESQAFCRLRGQLLPLVSLHGIFAANTKSFTTGPLGSGQADTSDIVVLESDGVSFGIVVEQIKDSIDIVVKPLGQILSSIGIFSGATILGDGQIALTLDVSGLASYAEIRRTNDNGNVLNISSDSRNQPAIELDEIDYLIFSLGDTGQYAVPICHVNRLEELASDDLRRAGDFVVVNYREALMPVISVAKLLRLEADFDSATNLPIKSVMVVNKGQKIFGFEVTEIKDIITTRADIDMELRDREGLIGGLIHQEQVYSVLDVFELIELIPRVFQHGRVQGQKSRVIDEKLRQSRNQYSLLLAEDSQFFRKQIMAFLVESGYQVTSVEDGGKAWKILQEEDPVKYSLIISDIEMPHLNGIELAKKIRSLKSLQDIPLLAVTSKFNDKDIAKGLKAGFSRYLQKLDRDELIYEIDHSLGILA